MLKWRSEIFQLFHLMIFTTVSNEICNYNETNWICCHLQKSQSSFEKFILIFDQYQFMMMIIDEIR